MFYRVGWVRGVALFLCMAVCVPSQSAADDNGQELTPREMLEAVDGDTRQRAVALLRAGDLAGAVSELADRTRLNEEEAAFLAQLLDFEWKKRAELDARTDRILGELPAADQTQLVSLVGERKRSLAISELTALTGLSSNDAAPIIATIERRLAAAGQLRAAPTGTPEQVIAGLDPSTRDRVIGLVSSGKKIQAIKELRAATGLGLKDSKDIVDAVAASTN